MRWITVGSAHQPGTSIVLEPPAADPRHHRRRAAHHRRDDGQRAATPTWRRSELPQRRQLPNRKPWSSTCLARRISVYGTVFGRSNRSYLRMISPSSEHAIEPSYCISAIGLHFHVPDNLPLTVRRGVRIGSRQGSGAEHDRRERDDPDHSFETGGNTLVEDRRSGRDRKCRVSRTPGPSGANPR
jgi:hypothetical protein